MARAQRAREARSLGFLGIAARERRLDRDQLQTQLSLDVLRDLGVLLQESSRVLLALPDALALVAVPGARLLDEAVQHAELDELALLGDAGAVHDLELGLAERRGHLVLHDLDARQRARHLLAVLDRADAPDVHAHR